jgi:hypothetical protein
VTPSSLPIRPAARNAIRHPAITTTTNREQHREPGRAIGGLAGQQDGRGDGAGTLPSAGSPAGRRRLSWECSSIRLLRRPWLACPCPQSEHHLEGDREQQQPAGHANCGRVMPSCRNSQVADQRRADQDRAGDQAGAQRHLPAETRRGAQCVTARNAGTRPTGSTTTSSVTSAEIRKLDGHRFDLR